MRTLIAQGKVYDKALQGQCFIKLAAHIVADFSVFVLNSSHLSEFIVIYRTCVSISLQITMNFNFFFVQFTLVSNMKHWLPGIFSCIHMFTILHILVFQSLIILILMSYIKSKFKLDVIKHGLSRCGELALIP